MELLLLRTFVPVQLLIIGSCIPKRGKYTKCQMASSQGTVLPSKKVTEITVHFILTD